MELLRSFWHETLGFLNEPMFTLGESDITLLRTLGLLLIFLVARRLSVVVQRGILRLTADQKDDPAVYLLQRISGYLVWLAAALMALNYLGFELSNLAFLGGAVGVGLGFGLQNILNNFVSGVIILFEKTLKVGDVVELQSGVTGKVTEINLRYTRITTSDQMDVLVPNSEFISGRVANWTYGEPVRRIHIPFVVAYGTDKERVREAALAAAHSLPSTLELDDERRRPDVWLTKMGDSGLEFELTVWVGVGEMEHPRTTQGHYLWALETELRNHQIEIPHPQRELHFKNQKLRVEVVGAKGASSPESG
ncbi:MAG: mechanosensitive ion channel [Nitrosomonadales bacterium]|nr:mechanosensitive ion channel [Nitrosomonadales bacterium]